MVTPTILFGDCLSCILNVILYAGTPWNGAMYGSSGSRPGRILWLAARALGISHPTVGRRIKTLEAEAGQALLRRTREGLILTNSGDAVFALAESMEASALAIERRLQVITSAWRESCASLRRTGSPLCAGAGPGRPDPAAPCRGTRGHCQLSTAGSLPTRCGRGLSPGALQRTGYRACAVS